MPLWYSMIIKWYIWQARTLEFIRVGKAKYIEYDVLNNWIKGLEIDEVESLSIVSRSFILDRYHIRGMMLVV